MSTHDRTGRFSAAVFIYEHGRRIEFVETYADGYGEAVGAAAGEAVRRLSAKSTGPADRIGAKLDADVPLDRCWVLPRVDSVGRPVEPGVPQPGNAPYTPSTDQVRAAYVRAMRNAFIASAGEHEQEFDRWLAATISDAVARDDQQRQAWEEGAWM